MMKSNPSLAIMIYGESNSGRDALSEEKYKDLATAFTLQEFAVSSVLYNDTLAEELTTRLTAFDAVLVWVNPVEQGTSRKQLDSLLNDIAGKGCFVSTHPEVILKMGTKEVLYTTREMDWGGDTKMYRSYNEFLDQFHSSLQNSGTRVLKQYRGNGGNGVYKIIYHTPGTLKVTHAMESSLERMMNKDDFYNEFRSFFTDGGMLLDQEWNMHIANGMVRCYLSGNKVAGFGYQEINALYEKDGLPIPPGKRYYYTEQCGLFSDLRGIMEKKWVPQMQEILSISNGMLPVIWDADFFINTIKGHTAAGKYTLCEINVSCVSPFPPSAIPFIVNNVSERLK